MAGALGRSICVLTLSSKSMNDATLNRFLNMAPENSIILLEDLDCAFPSREQTKKGIYMPITFSGILNALDGVASQRGRLVVMTTNHITRLDPAIVRPGRVDKSVKFGLASRRQLLRMWARFYPDAHANGETFADLVGNEQASMAELQGLFLVNKDGTGDGALAAVPKFLEQVNESSSYSYGPLISLVHPLRSLSVCTIDW